ncbi:amino acid ABC transporter permease [Helicobacter cetorum]|uniref:Amino acid ABC transporter, permease protein n=1 Tax=Helicobacter cetorum (strain ATCC BAA-540 / CCUG 52418 / MIT 99-5656) TaxID=1163745 RepID=I0ER55_HELCM|nr:amino acid ABC transporter permease [Helicobacter cetorum]AFI05424.1 amino acid ABC transporter, permease protein [Helicobacter cetorum MIT 99-5656]
MLANNNLLFFLEPFNINKERLELLLEAFYPMLKAAFCISMPLAIISFILGLSLAIFVALVKISPPKHLIHKILLLGLNFYVSLMRGTPLLVQIVVVFYGLPALGVYIDPIPAGIIAFSLSVGAYASETLRASFLSIPKDQWESSLSLGLSYLQTFWHIIFFQALKVATPSLSNTFISLFKDTSLASVVTIAEIFRIAQQKANTSYDFLPIYLEAALIYWLFCLVLGVIQRRVEKILN